VQVLNELTNVARRNMQMSWADTHALLNLLYQKSEVLTHSAMPRTVMPTKVGTTNLPYAQRQVVDGVPAHAMTMGGGRRVETSGFWYYAAC
jgi:hypothetical protein